MLKAPFPYFGGKSRMADVIWDRLGNVANYVEPFAGSLAVLLLRPHPPKVETVNDIDCYLANFWRALAGDPEGVAEWADWPVNEADLHARHQWLVGQAEFRERMKRDPDFFDAKIAGWWVWGISQWIGSGWCSHPEWRGRTNAGRDMRGVHRQRPHLKSEDGIFRRQNLSAYFDELAGRLRRVRVCCGDWSRVLAPCVTFVQGLTGVFLDPPYDLRIVRSVISGSDGGAPSEGLYNHHANDVSAAVRAWAVANGSNPLLRICLAGYEEEHGAFMPPDWECVPWKANGGYSNLGENNENPWRERLWFSPHCLRPQESLFAAQEWRETAIAMG